MKPQHAHEHLAAFAATTVGILLAILVGTLTGRGQTGLLLLILVICAGVGLCLWLKQRIWILMPMFWTLTGQIRELPIPFAVRDLIVGSVFAISLIFIALKIIREKPKYQLVDFVLGAVLLYLLTTFLRNPVGVAALDSQRIGGKPYFNVFLATLAYWVFSRVSVTPKEARTFPIIIGLGGMLNSVLHAITFYLPALTPWMSRFYSGVAVENLAEGYGGDLARQTYLTGATIPLLGLFSYFRPIRVLNPLNWWLFIPTVLCSVAVLLTGFRSMTLAMFVYFCIASYVRTGWRDIIRCAMVGVPLLGILLLGQGRLFNLPFPIQRSLSSLPGAWHPQAIRDAQQSSEWRYYMWKIVLTEDKYIMNKWLGDGFGFSRREFAIIQRMSVTNEVAGDQESVMVMGGVHSGPISTIRVIGFVGLIGYTFFLILFAKYAWRLIRRAQKTPFFPMALFLGVPVIWEPFGFFFIFGSFDYALANSIFTLGLLNMLNNSLQLAEVPQQDVPARDLPIRRQAPRELMPVPSRGGLVWQPRRS